MLHQARPRGVLTPRERSLLLAIAEAVLPPGKRFPGATERTIDRVDHFLASLPEPALRSYRAMLQATNASALLWTLRPFERLSSERRLEVLERHRRGGVARRLALRAMLMPIKGAHFDDPALFRALGCVYDFGKRAGEAKPRWMQERMHAAAGLPKS